MKEAILIIIGIFIPAILIANGRNVTPVPPIDGGSGGVSGGGDNPPVPGPIVDPLSAWGDAIRFGINANSNAQENAVFHIYNAFVALGDGDPYKLAYIYGCLLYTSPSPRDS